MSNPTTDIRNVVNETKKIKGGEAVFYGRKGDHPCGVKIRNHTDPDPVLDIAGILDVEVHNCNNITFHLHHWDNMWDKPKIRDDIGWGLSDFNAEEVLNAIVEGVRRCGCSVKIKE